MVGGLINITPNVVGMDILWEATKSTRLRDVLVIQGSGFSLPFKDNSFDCIICNDMIHNLPYELSDILLRELVRVTRERIIIGAVRNGVASFLDLGLLLLAIRRGRLLEGSNINTGFYHFWRITRALPKYNLKILRIQPSAHFIALFERYTLYKRIYRIKPGRIGILGWALPLPYGVLQYDILLVKKDSRS
ncbi:MAG TPA: class I SAM-dependent methyltransferase [Gammaproteobacteria bacterium]|nr:class I SAM-dependent methyltransferase [Gammaproteobacteria bacterium]